MTQEGPALEVLLRRLVDTPPDFLEEPRLQDAGRVHVAALVNDVLHLHGQRAAASALMRFDARQPTAQRNRLALVMIVAWLLADDAWVQRQLPHEALLDVLDDAVALMAAITPAHQFIRDPDRRQELARSVLARLSLRPAGETEQQADDRLVALSGIARRDMAQASRAAQQRARAVREALTRKAAEESADKWTRE